MHLGGFIIILNHVKSALEDFLAAYEHALHSNDQERDPLSFRALLGAFLVYMRLADEMLLRSILDPLSLLIGSNSYCECNEQPSYHRFALTVSKNRKTVAYPRLRTNPYQRLSRTGGDNRG